MKKSIDLAVYYIARIAFCLVQALSVDMCMRLAAPIIWIAVDILKIRADVVDENLRHAFPGMGPAARRRLARRHWEHLALMMVEILHARRKIHLTNWRDYVCFRNKRALVRTLLERRPHVVVSGHYGNFEIGAMIVGMFGFPMFTIARPLDNRYLDRFINGCRSAYGLQVLQKKGSADDAADLLSRGGSLLVLGDQAAGPKGCWVNFFGREASTHKAISVFSLSFNAPMVVTYTKRHQQPMMFEIGGEAIADPDVDTDVCGGVRELTTWFSNHIENVIRRDPYQYWWAHRRWKGKRPQRRRRPRNAA